MFKSFLVFLCFLLFSSSSFSVDKKITLLIYLDLSESMYSRRSKVSKLIPHITKKMEKTCGSYRIGVSNILYTDIKNRKFSPYGTPRYINQDTPDALEKLSYRLLTPFDNSSAVDLASDSDIIFNLASGTREMTYSSIVESVKKNHKDFIGQDLLATLLLTDALPAYENSSAEASLVSIHQILGNTAFVSGAIAMKSYNGMSLNSLGENCTPDHSGLNIPDRTSPISTQGFMNEDLEALEKFTKKSGGWLWDVCEKEYQNTIDDFLQTVFEKAGCQVLM